MFFVFPLAELDEFYFESGAFGFEDFYVFVDPALFEHMEIENLAACRIGVLERIIEKQRIVPGYEFFVFERVIHESYFAETFGHCVDFVVFNSSANCAVFFDDVR